jgi:TolB-like protein
MRLLLYLMEHRDRVVGQQELLDNIWANVVVTPQSVYSTIAQLRQALGDSTDSPSYIATIPRKGYRLIAPVSAGPSPVALPSAAPAPEPVRADVSAPALIAQPQPVTYGTSSLRVLRGLAIVAGVALSILAIIYLRMHRESQRPAQQPLAVSIGVLPFLDLSEKQDSQYLADGVTEELIDILAHESALRVPARTSSFYFKGRTETVAAIARQLNVANLLEGSVRRSDGKIRVTAQLIRADDGFHLWSETYTRDGEDIFAVEDDIAQSVANVLRARLTPSVSVGAAYPLDSAAHNLMLECQFYRERNTAADGEKAVACFRRLVESHTGMRMR